MSTKHFVRATEYGLKVDRRPWRDLLPKKPFRMSHKHPWVMQDGVLTALFRTDNPWMPTQYCYLDDLNIAGWSPLGSAASRESAILRRTTLGDFYDSCKLVESPKTSPNPTQTPEMTGHVADYKNQQIGFSTEKWEKFGEGVSFLQEHRTERISVSVLLKIAGFAAHIAQLFFRARIFVTPLSRWLGLIGAAARSDKDLWRKLKKWRVYVPAALIDMMVL